ncbi:ATP-binding domain-containing protein [Microbacterium sp. NPDC089321]|uniref:DEAD/DEAH box helicase n=1 Tax=Microbacterium sp. NPDC089321 TaxID=3155183 RepID=UPI00341A3251
MALEVIRGESKNRGPSEALADRLALLGLNGDLYLGYPVLSTSDDRVRVDALLVSPEHGLIAFQIAPHSPGTEDDWAQLVEAQDQLFAALESQLSRYDSLRRGRRLGFDINTVTVFGTAPGEPLVDTSGSGIYCALDDLAQEMRSLQGIESTYRSALQSALQRVSTIRPANKRSSVTRPSSRGAKLKEIEREIANLDHWQNRAAIEMPEGPQRIRGLAGSGKTIVLALKAAYLHAQHPDWRIAVTFQSRALYQQFESLIVRFTAEHLQDSPDFSRLTILHAWGASNRAGVYNTIATHLGMPPRDYTYASAKFGRDDAFGGVCGELLAVAEAAPSVEPIFDVVLIDEAQDLPPEFFRLVYQFTKDPKRIVWGYDELQKLSEASMPTMAEMFGTDESGEPLVSLDQQPNEALRDIVLPTCYRNTHWSLATAHALGYGIYREGGLVQHFDDPKLWLDVGYTKTEGRLELGRPVTLERSQASTPEFFPRLLTDTDAVLVKKFDSELAQDEWVAEQIQQNLGPDELEPTDILVVFPLPWTAKSRALSLRKALARRKIPSHLVGVNSSVDEIRVIGSVAMAHIHRAKGNEAAMVYVMDAHSAGMGNDVVTRRNTIFTAITRNKAWVRVVGHGRYMDPIASEIAQVREEQYRLRFKLPTRTQLDAMRRDLRGKTKEEIERLQRTEENLRDLVHALDAGTLSLEDVPLALRAEVVSRLQPQLDLGPIDDDA